MTSATKYRLDPPLIRGIFDAAGINGVEEISPLKDGEFNSAFSVSAGGKDYVLKIAPNAKARVLSYEKDMMRQELNCYDLLREKAEIPVPEIFFRDFSQKIISAPYFIMAKIPFPRLDTLTLSPQERREVLEVSADMLARMHRIGGPGCGYPQTGLEPNWYLGIREMVSRLVKDAARFGKKCPPGKELLRYIDKFQDTLKRAPRRLVNFDFWDTNLFYEKTGSSPRLWLIDPERSFWGDPVADLVCLDITHMKLEEKAEVMARYNRTAKITFSTSREIQIRYYIMLAYLGVIMYTERFSRYRFWQNGYRRNSLLTTLLTRQSFGVLRNL